MKCSIINGSTISFDPLATPLQHIILDRVAVGGSCKITRTDPAHFAESLCQPGSTLHTNFDQQYADWWSKQRVDLSIIEHFIHCDAYKLIKRKTWSDMQYMMQ